MFSHNESSKVAIAKSGANLMMDKVGGGGFAKQGMG